MEERIPIEVKIAQRSFEAYSPNHHGYPPVEIKVVRNTEPYGPYGRSVVGEPSITPVFWCNPDAVSDAIGVPRKQIPLTPERILCNSFRQ
jgi:CO/xanthine dehydrogenase Mo-binding subunit